MGRTACTEPQCLYKGALYLYLTTALLAEFRIYSKGEVFPVDDIKAYGEAKV